MTKDIQEVMVTQTHSKEYILTNGLGGYSLNPIDHNPTRKYHGLYTISKVAPVERWHLISRLVETVCIEGDNHLLPHCDTFQYDGVATHHYQMKAIKITRHAAFKKNSNLLTISYTIESPLPLELTLTPTFNFRDHHHLIDPNPKAYVATYDIAHQTLLVEAYDLQVYVKSSGSFSPGCQVLPAVDYAIEKERGYPSEEQHLDLGSFLYKVPSGTSTIEVQINTKDAFSPSEAIFKAAREQVQTIIEKSQLKNPRLQALIRSSDDFIVQRDYPATKTIIAGYPWFTDWGRDTMIALPGLLLTTQRYEEAFEIIHGFLLNLNHGIIPNTFPDQGETPHYNTVDGTLWLFNALFALYEKTHNTLFIQDAILYLKQILAAHIEGTLNNIHMDKDGLLVSGDASTQLTWMDVKIEGWVVTPRYGKVVEINSLWYNAICIYLHFKAELGQRDPFDIKLLSIKSKLYRHFNADFIHPDLNRLYDYLADGQSIDIPRPNMLLAISLPFPILAPAYWRPVVSYCKELFKTPVGLRTLCPNDPDYIGIYEGSLLSRDGAYHRGTVWPWLIGPYLEAHYKAFQDLTYIHQQLDDILDQVDNGLVGSLPEIYDGDAPHQERGCPTQAWSVAEVLRIADMFKY
jgi:predicted glycogen debranching enzyme